MEHMEYDILIVGGGAAGLTAAVCAGRFAESFCPAPPLRIAVVEKKDVTGKKLSATGNGRCNLSNAACTDRAEVDGFFRAVGLVTRTDDAGRMYPYGEEAAEVTALLTKTARDFHTEFFMNCQVTQICPVPKRKPEQDCSVPGGFVVEINRKDPGRGDSGFMTLRCRRLLLAAGGKSCSVFGTTGDGYVLARQLGHRVTSLAPSLVPVQVDADLRDLAGVRTKASVQLLHQGRRVAAENGEVQFQKDCISGICIMNLSRLLVLNREKTMPEAFREYEIVLDLMPEYSMEEVRRMISGKNGSLQTLVKRKLAGWILKQYEMQGRCSAEGKDLAFLLKHLTFSVTGTKGWNDAQVTRGGVAMDEVDPDTMESKRIPGLYFSGEILDYDGPCGGFNLHFAWKSGIRAGKAMADAIRKERE
ncbi:MAG: aminoacetone oxidase family FAD-binding enzyme [Firmicutes bacterium]|nr:aminoacetone oxidase family FAD-binding enzyme [Bacillota bacterium]MDD7601677.1 aminoacetone oxidase family FAD-binding enzyme [Bacillota bacterium]MDY5857546.1 aminoacetone oxidase family FAD-binding enzyme [Anaerovoracaceae bacterium]